MTWNGGLLRNMPVAEWRQTHRVSLLCTLRTQLSSAEIRAPRRNSASPRALNFIPWWALAPVYDDVARVVSFFFSRGKEKRVHWQPGIILEDRNFIGNIYFFFAYVLFRVTDVKSTSLNSWNLINHFVIYVNYVEAGVL